MAAGGEYGGGSVVTRTGRGVKMDRGQCAEEEQGGKDEVTANAARVRF